MTCGCAAETVLNMDGKKCLAAAKKIRDECTESIQCTATFEFSTCVDNMYQCEQNFHYEHELTRCFSNKAIGDEYECYQAEDYENDPSIKSVTCNSNTCTCADNYILSENKCVSAEEQQNVNNSDVWPKIKYSRREKCKQETQPKTLGALTILVSKDGISKQT
ncbi:uncharacterized protein LOC143895100 isoform X1 [Temnothorax americanus]|uniref:uncharacterized protein LOC143895100 isoform X1 n=1 Tax=Temnothorax americanus TaxID=1964332 RepID=UPI004068C670